MEVVIIRPDTVREMFNTESFPTAEHKLNGIEIFSGQIFVALVELSKIAKSDSKLFLLPGEVIERAIQEIQEEPGPQTDGFSLCASMFESKRATFTDFLHEILDYVLKIEKEWSEGHPGYDAAAEAQADLSRIVSDVALMNAQKRRRPPDNRLGEP